MDKRPHWKQQDKSAAKLAHLKFLSRLDAQDIVVYTDGSACPNPGKIGLGVSYAIGSDTYTFEKPIGIGSNITAELCGINFALEKLMSINTGNSSRIFIFCDCQHAIDLVLGKITTNHSFDVVREAKENLEKLRSRIQVMIKWVPAHVGVEGNEKANTAAQSAAKKVNQKSPLAGQPAIPLATSKSLIMVALRERHQQRWLKTVRKYRGMEHLSRLRADTTEPVAFFVGSKQEQRILARLRLGTCELNASRSRRQAEIGDLCTCGKTETVHHFLLECPLYQRHRKELVQKVRSVYKGIINEETLLGGSALPIFLDSWQAIVPAVATYVRATKREI